MTAGLFVSKELDLRVKRILCNWGPEMAVTNIKRKMLTTNGSMHTYTEQRYVSKYSASYHQAVKQHAEVVKFDSKLTKLLDHITEFIDLNTRQELEYIEKSNLFTVAKDHLKIIYIDGVSAEVQQSPETVELYMLDKLRHGNVFGLARNSTLGVMTLSQDFQAMIPNQKAELVTSILEATKTWKRLILPTPTVKKYGNDPTIVNTLSVVISIDFEWKYTKLKSGEVRQFGDVLSGQYAMFFPDYPKLDIHGIIFNDSDRGFNFRQFFLALVDRIQAEFIASRSGRILRLKLTRLNVLLTGYFMGVDFSALTGWNNLKANLTVIDKQKIFSTRPYVFNVRHKKTDGGVDVSMTFRDTALLAPQGGLKALGEMVGIPKIDTTRADRLDAQSGVISQAEYLASKDSGGYYKSHMDMLLKNHPKLYADYALNDSVVALKYLRLVMKTYQIPWNNFMKIPPTTSNYAMSGAVAALDGAESSQRIFNPSLPFRRVKDDPVAAVRDLYRYLYIHSSNAYFGGFNVAFTSLVGQALIVDTDLSSAYNSGGKMMPRPDYSKNTVLNDLQYLFKQQVVFDGSQPVSFKNLYDRLKLAAGFPFILGTICADFSYPSNYRGIVTTPQRSPDTDNPTYVLAGESIDLPIIDVINAYEHGATITIKSAYIPAQYWDRSNVWSAEQTRFLKLRQDAKRHRDQVAKGSADYKRYDAIQTLMKLAGNSVYGKSAQSIHKKRSRNYMTNVVEEVNISKISDPVIAGAYTAITRYLVHHLYDAISNVYATSVVPLNITTDGYTFALINGAQYDFTKIDKRFNSTLPSYYRSRLKSIGYTTGFERKGDGSGKIDYLTRFYNGRTRFNGTVDNATLHAMGGVYYSSSDDLSQEVKLIYDLYMSGEISIKSSSYRMSNLTEMKFGARNHDQGVMYDWTIPVRLPLQYDCAYQPSEWIGNQVNGFGFLARPFGTVREHDIWKANSKTITDRWNIMQSKSLFLQYLSTMNNFSFSRRGKTLDDPDYQNRARYIFNRLSGGQVPAERQYRSTWSSVQKALQTGGKLPVCLMAINQNKKVGN